MIKKKTETQSPLYLDLFSHRYISELSCFSLMHYSTSSIQVNKYNNPHICHWATVGLIWLYFTLFSDTVNTLKKKHAGTKTRTLIIIPVGLHALNTHVKLGDAEVGLGASFPKRTEHSRWYRKLRPYLYWSRLSTFRLLSNLGIYKFS